MNPRLYRFTVTGRGTFPYDMLRYDQAWPLSQAVPYLSQDRMEQYAESRTQPVRLEFMSLGLPTHDRWASFGWFVIQVERP